MIANLIMMLMGLPFGQAETRAAVEALGSPSYRERQAATALLVAADLGACPALIAATGDPNPERASRAKKLLGRIYCRIPMDPGNLEALREGVGETYHFRVTGETGVTLWGTNPYTSDSRLAVAAVHSGTLQPGQMGIVHIRITEPLPSYPGGEGNGVTSHPWEAYPGAYEILVSDARKMDDHD